MKNRTIDAMPSNLFAFTSSGTSAEMAGISKAIETFQAARQKTMNVPNLDLAFENEPTRSQVRIAICTICVAIRIFRLSNRSAAEPPIIVSTSVGKPAARFTIPSMIALFGQRAMTQPCAITCIHVPVSEMSEPMM